MKSVLMVLPPPPNLHYLKVMRWYENISTFYYQISISFGQTHSPAVLLHQQISETPCTHLSFLSPSPHFHFSTYTVCYLIRTALVRKYMHPGFCLIAHTLLPVLMLIWYVTYSNTPVEVINCRNIYIHIYLICRNIMLELVFENVTMWNELYIKNAAVLILAFFSTHQSTSIWSVISDLHWYEMLQGSLHPDLQTHSCTYSPPPIFPLTQPVGSEPSRGI